MLLWFESLNTYRMLFRILETESTGCHDRKSMLVKSGVVVTTNIEIGHEMSVG
jgi:hypothetical protein